jgi:hypothetical protein
VSRVGEAKRIEVTWIDPLLSDKAQGLVLWSLDEDKSKEAVMSALSLAINPFIATPTMVQNLTFKATQLLLADGGLRRE